MINISIADWKNYELIDSGDFEKLERFGTHVLCRPEPQAVWKKSLSQTQWDEMFHARYIRKKGDFSVQSNIDKGQWFVKKGVKEQWYIDYDYKEMCLRFRLGLTSFGHIGVFPEQAANWNYIFDFIRNSAIRQPKVLNLFAYTGGASLAAKAAGADVTHVDSVKQVITWSRENMEASGLQDIRWVVEDALKYVKREAKRGKKYQGIILDPPAYGRGPEGEKWILQDLIYELLVNCTEILEKENIFVLLNLYSMGFSSVIGENLLKQLIPDYTNIEIGELTLKGRNNLLLPLSVYSRIER